jgi:hypothetical protein
MTCEAALWIRADDLAQACAALERNVQSYMHRELSFDEMAACERVIHALTALRNAEIVDAKFNEAA